MDGLCVHVNEIFMPKVLRTLKRVEHKQHLGRGEKSPGGVATRENEREGVNVRGGERRIPRIIFIAKKTKKKNKGVCREPSEEQKQET